MNENEKYISRPTLIKESENRPEGILASPELPKSPKAQDLERERKRRKKAEKSLRKREAALEKALCDLDEARVALNIILEKAKEDQAELENRIMVNFKELVAPILNKIKKSKTSQARNNYLSVLESNLNEIFSPFAQTLEAKFLDLTPSEIRTANLIRKGMTTREIAAILALSPRTIECHRNSLRMKMGLKNKKINLRTYLLTLE